MTNGGTMLGQGRRIDPRPEIEVVREDVGISSFMLTHSRFRVYPQDTGVTAILTSPAAINTFGNWAEIVPLNTVPFLFHIVGIVIEQVSGANTLYFIQLGYNTINADPGANMEIGERRVRIATQPIVRATELLEVRGQGVPANSRVMGRLKTSNAAGQTCNLSVVLTRHLIGSYEPALYPAFPW